VRILKRIVVFSPFRGILLPVYLLLGLLLMIVSLSYFKDLLIFVGISRKLSYFFAFELSFLSLALSPVNIVLKEVKKRDLSQSYDVVYVFGIPFYVPKLSLSYTTTLIAFNIGGALIPLLLSLTLLFYLFSKIFLILINIILITAISKYFSKVIPGVGVVMHPLIPPIFSTIISYILFFHQPILVPVSAYIGSVFGTLIGADLLNLRKIIEASPQIVSIGGMGSFDGIFLSGLFSVVFGELLISI
jgi:uncharacterized membrane protein